MNISIRRILVISAFPVTIAFIVALLTSGPLTLEKYVNTLFYFALSIALIGIALYVVKGGFFDFFSFSFKKVVKTLSKTPDVQDEISFKSNFHLSERVNVSFMKSFLYSGLFLTFLSIAVAYAL
ncbi:DUF3899 domain-containing protein [Fictibacillus phosphorivorans]|uniref:DUF3899 domain-containing protein n=1 Tax=Fictibacillus phosphorivorans TaxID=1221500 RepID=UPI002040BCD3|nr:DUF3899 domain-containing protein [Fictibacillus phosphorivorans]MCM3719109.1 DUF3899 domain-containing protein [Fictibacillus phosphorivorans]MCM3776731.1 DUF3899 domain-containing protein [Fictibacillus phosphorivorans]